MPSFGEQFIFIKLTNDIFKKNSDWVRTCALMLNLFKNARTFCTKIFDPVNNYVHNGKNQPHQGVRDGYLCFIVKPLNIYVLFVLYRANF